MNQLGISTKIEGKKEKKKSGFVKDSSKRRDGKPKNSGSYRIREMTQTG